MRFVGGLLVSLLLVTGLSACTSSDGEWSRNRAPSREAAARADDREAECKDPYVFDYDEEDSAGSRREQVVFALEHNDDDAEKKDRGAEQCPNLVTFDDLAGRYDWTSITSVKEMFDLIAEQDPESLSVETVSNSLLIDPNPVTVSKYEFNSIFRYASIVDPVIENFPGVTHKTFKTSQGTYQPNAALLPSHSWQEFYQDQHLMTFGVCDAVAEEATVFFFDPNFIDQKYEYHKAWSEGSTVTQRSLPAPRFRFPFKAEDTVQQPELISIQVVDTATKQPIGAALIEVFVSQKQGDAPEASAEAGKQPKGLHRCEFDLKITRTYEKETVEKRLFNSEIENSRSYLEHVYGFGIDLIVSCTSPWSVQVRRNMQLIYADFVVSFATDTDAFNFKHSAEDGWLPPDEDDPWKVLANQRIKLSLPKDEDWPKVHEILVTLATTDGDLFSRQYHYVQVDQTPGQKQYCDWKNNSLMMHFFATGTEDENENTKNNPEDNIWKDFFDN